MREGRSDSLVFENRNIFQLTTNLFLSNEKHIHIHIFGL